MSGTDASPSPRCLTSSPLERVLKVHVAGGYYLDAHVGAPDDELLVLTASVIPRLPNLRAVRYEAVPESLEFDYRSGPGGYPVTRQTRCRSQG